MSRTDDIANLAAAIRHDLRDGKWHRSVGLGGWGHDIGLHGAALNLLAREELIEHDTRRNTYRLTTKRPEHQLNIYEED